MCVISEFLDNSKSMIYSKSDTGVKLIEVPLALFLFLILHMFSKKLQNIANNPNIFVKIWRTYFVPAKIIQFKSCPPPTPTPPKKMRKVFNSAR